MYKSAEELGKALGAKQPRPKAMNKDVPDLTQENYSPAKAPNLPGFGRIFQWPTRPTQNVGQTLGD